MEINNLTALAGIQPRSKSQSSNSPSLDQNFLNNFIGIAQAEGKSGVPQVYAGTGKELNFWVKDDKAPSKKEKERTLEDVIAEIKEILNFQGELNS